MGRKTHGRRSPDASRVHELGSHARLSDARCLPLPYLVAKLGTTAPHGHAPATVPKLTCRVRCEPAGHIGGVLSVIVFKALKTED
jgi:hypothetical protein